jgi:lipoprotein-anchoring transpeptidase ErfK/SrfK
MPAAVNTAKFGLRIKFKWIAIFIALFAGLLFQAAPAAAGVIAKVDIATQSMTVIVDGNVEAVWAVSTARRGYYTPRGVYQPKELQRMHYSKKYHNSPMPYSVFFKGGYAVHGTYEVSHLGKAASHGCIRLAPQNAAALYQLIRAHGISDTQLQIS